MVIREKDNKIRDFDIRYAYIKEHLELFDRDDFEFVNEFGINSTNRVDFALLDFKNKYFYGFEIKSEQDNTKRLIGQLKSYITFFNIIHVIAHTKHVQEIKEIIEGTPYFHGIGLIEATSDLKFKGIRKAKPYKPTGATFIGNLDLEELRILAQQYNLPLDSPKKVLLGQLRKYVKYEDVYENIYNKLRRNRLAQCPYCGSKLYYNKQGKFGINHVCYKCGRENAFD